jgi:hypothetical protein
MAGTQADRSHALFRALVSCQTPVVDSQLNDAAGQLSHVGPGCFTTLHAAVLGGCAGALPGLVARGRRWTPRWRRMAGMHHCWSFWTAYK